MDEVTERLSAVIDVCRARQSRLGYFAALYRQAIEAVACDLEAGLFDDGDRMHRFAGLLARRYLDALTAFEHDNEVTRSWSLTFATAARDDAVILQHVLVGANAHLNLDLALAAAQVSRSAPIVDLEADFRRVVDTIVAVVGRAQAAIGAFSPVLSILGRLADRPDDEILRFSFRVAGDEAWRRALLMSALPVGRWPAMVDSLDRATAVLGRSIAHPGGILAPAVEIVRHAEVEEVPAVIEALASLDGDGRDEP